MHTCNDTTSNVTSNKVVSYILVVLSLHAVYMYQYLTFVLLCCCIEY